MNGISDMDRITLIGILALAKEYRHHLNNLVHAACRITGETPDESGYAGHTSDAIWGRYMTVDELLTRIKENP